MPPALERLEQRISELLELIDSLRRENESFLRAASDNAGQLSSQDALEQIEQLKRENRKLRDKLESADKKLGAVIDELEKAGQSGGN